MSEKIELQNIAVWGNSFLDDSQDIHGVFKKLKNLSTPDSLSNQIINVDEEQIETNLIVFADQGLAQPDGNTIPAGKYNFMLFTVQDDDISFSVDLDADLMDDFEGLFDQVLSEIDLHVTGFNMDFTLDCEFQDLKFSIEGPENFNFDGVRFNDGDFSYIVQRAYGDPSESISTELEHDVEVEENPGKEDDEDSMPIDKYTVSDVKNIGHFDIAESGTFIRNKVDEARATLSEILP